MSKILIVPSTYSPAKIKELSKDYDIISVLFRGVWYILDTVDVEDFSYICLDQDGGSHTFKHHVIDMIEMIK